MLTLVGPRWAWPSIAWMSGRGANPACPRQGGSWYTAGMEAISRNITDLAADQRSAIEQLLGTRLTEHQRIVVQVMDADKQEPPHPPRTIDDYAILADLDHLVRLNYTSTNASCYLAFGFGPTYFLVVSNNTLLGGGDMSSLLRPRGLAL